VCDDYQFGWTFQFLPEKKEETVKINKKQLKNKLNISKERSMK
jgi:hypothetical protein